MATQSPQPGGPEDLQVDGPYSPLSLAKLSTKLHDGTEFKVLLDQSGLGFAHDDPSMLYMTIQARLEQAYWWVDNKFDGRRVFPWMYRYLHYMFIDGSFKYKDDVDVIACMQEGKITEDMDEYKHIISLVKYCKTNVEAAQIIGCIQLLVMTFKQCTKDGVPVSIFIEQPETSLHPKREAKWMSMFYDIKKNYYDYYFGTNETAK